jgi:hypothetical protein
VQQVTDVDVDVDLATLTGAVGSLLVVAVARLDHRSVPVVGEAQRVLVANGSVHPAVDVAARQTLLPVDRQSRSWSAVRVAGRAGRSTCRSSFAFVQVISSYDDVPHSCFLYLISIIVDEYGDDRDFKSSIILISEHLTTKTFSILVNPAAFAQFPDLVDDFYRLSSR